MQSDNKREKNKHLLTEVYNLPSMPVIIYEVTRLLDNAMTSINDLVKVISKDQGLTAKILTVANSPFYGLPRKVATIDFAIVILGFEQVKSIVIALSIMNAIKNKSDQYLDQRQFWTHSVLTAMTAKRITEDLGYHFSGEAFTAGLLHDLGLSIMHKYFHDEFVQVYELSLKNGVTFRDNEEKILGLTHEEVGKILSEKWNFPGHLKDAITYHHHPSKSEQNKVLTSLIHLSDYMTNYLKIGNYNWDSNYSYEKEIIDILKLGNEDYLEKFILSYKNLFIKQMETLNI